MKRPRLFLSYATADRAFANRLRSAFAKNGATVVDALASMEPGDIFSDVIGKSLSASDAVVFIVPKQEGEGKAAWFELGAAKALGKPILPIAPDRARRANTADARQLSGLHVIQAEGRSPSDIAEEAMITVGRFAAAEGRIGRRKAAEVA